MARVTLVEIKQQLVAAAQANVALRTRVSELEFDLEVTRTAKIRALTYIYARCWDAAYTPPAPAPAPAPVITRTGYTPLQDAWFFAREECRKLTKAHGKQYAVRDRGDGWPVIRSPAEIEAARYGRVA